MAPKILPVIGALLLLGGCADGNPWFGSAASARLQQPSQTLTHATPPPGSGEPLANAAPIRRISLVVLHSEATLQLLIKSRKVTLRSPDDFILQSRRLEKTLSLDNSDWVFVGYGVTVPALGWDNYQNRDMHGKTVIMLAGAPPIPDGTQVSSQAALRHPVASNLGHWRTKFDNAQRHGAALAIILHDPKIEGAGYDRLFEFQDVVMAAPAQETPETLMAFGWMPEARAVNWLKRAGVRWDTLKQKAGMANFSPIDLPIQSHLQLANHWREMDITVPQ